MKIEPVGEDSAPLNEPILPSLAPLIQERVKKIQDPALRDELSSLIGDVEEKGKKLFSSKARQEFEDYKTSVKKFMQRIIQGSFKLEEKQSRKRDGKFVVYLTTQKVDEALDHLGQMLLAGQQDSMRVLAALDEIRGMLLDLYL
jgi:uncharacterized protein